MCKKKTVQEYKDIELKLSSYLSFIRNFDEFPEQERWGSVFEEISKKIVSSFSNIEDFGKQRNALTELDYFFAPRMGSFREDAPRELVDLNSSLYKAFSCIMRYIWKAEGNEVHDIKPSELFKVGDTVNLIQGHLMSISFSGHKEYADFIERHRYIIIEIMETDISNMPQYLIQFEKHSPVVRHDAVMPSTT